MNIDMFGYGEDVLENKKIQEISEAHDLVVEMKHEAEKYAKLASLAANAEIQTLRNNLRGRWLHLTYLIKDAKKWLSMLRNGDKIDSRKKYEEKENFEFLGHQIEELLGVEEDTITITEISSLGFDECAHYIVFTVDQVGRVFELTIPETEKLDTKNLDYCQYGKLVLCVRDSERNYSWDCFASSYDTKELKEKFQKFIKS